jgi:hypothetical protein
VRLVVLAPLIAIAALGGARAARVWAKSEAVQRFEDPPFAPSPGAAPFVTLGYRELGADLLFIRMVGYYGSTDNEASGLADLAAAIAVLDPTLRRTYDFGAVSMTSAKRGVTNEVRLRAIDLLAAGARAFPDNWRIPKLAGEIYLSDLVTDDPVQKRKWNEAGIQLLETATRKPNAPAEMSMIAATLRSKLGQRQRAIDSLREMLLITSDQSAREQLIKQLAKISDADSDEIAAEMLEARAQFDTAWATERPAVTPGIYIQIGPRPRPGFDLTDLATGGRDLIGVESFERLDPPADP